MKVYLIWGLLFVGIHGEQKVNLEDIESDNLRAEGGHNSGSQQDTKYSIPSDYRQQQYQIPNKYNRPHVSPISYTPSQTFQNHPPESYVQPNKYTVKEQAYQQQNSIHPEQTLPSQYYNDYQQQQPPKGIAPNVYQSQPLAYQPEVTVGNQLQSIQQQTVSAKYAKNVNKDTVYVNIPMMHLLTYYPNLNMNSGKSSGLLSQPVLTTASTEQISIPLYTSALSQKAIIPVKPTYQVQYAPKYSPAVPATFTNKVTKGPSYTSGNSKNIISAPLISLPTYVPSDQSYAQGRQLLYTQAYIAQNKPQYVPQLVYAQPTTVYMHATPVYSDVYAREPSYVQDNTLHASFRYNTIPEESSNPAPTVDETSKQVLGQETSQTVSQNYVKELDEPSSDLVPPQIPPQSFRTGVTPLAPVPSQDDESVSSQNHVGSSEPQSLLDSYVPSKLIAAQDSVRYQERPIQLESGFLPSKENFLSKKRRNN